MKAIRVNVEGVYSICDTSYESMAAELGKTLSEWEIGIPDMIGVSPLDDQHLPPNTLISQLTGEAWRGTVYLLRAGYEGLSREDTLTLLDRLEGVEDSE